MCPKPRISFFGGEGSGNGRDIVLRNDANFSCHFLMFHAKLDSSTGAYQNSENEEVLGSHACYVCFSMFYQCVVLETFKGQSSPRWQSCLHGRRNLRVTAEGTNAR